MSSIHWGYSECSFCTTSLSEDPGTTLVIGAGESLCLSGDFVYSSDIQFDGGQLRVCEGANILFTGNIQVVDLTRTARITTSGKITFQNESNFEYTHWSIKVGSEVYFQKGFSLGQNSVWTNFINNGYTKVMGLYHAPGNSSFSNGGTLDVDSLKIGETALQSLTVSNSGTVNIGTSAYLTQATFTQTGTWKVLGDLEITNTEINNSDSIIVQGNLQLTNSPFNSEKYVSVGGLLQLSGLSEFNNLGLSGRVFINDFEVNIGQTIVNEGRIEVDSIMNSGEIKMYIGSQLIANNQFQNISTGFFSYGDTTGCAEIKTSGATVSVLSTLTNDSLINWCGETTANLGAATEFCGCLGKVDEACFVDCDQVISESGNINAQNGETICVLDGVDIQNVFMAQGVTVKVCGQVSFKQPIDFNQSQFRIEVYDSVSFESQINVTGNQASDGEVYLAPGAKVFLNEYNNLSGVPFTFNLDSASNVFYSANAVLSNLNVEIGVNARLEFSNDVTFTDNTVVDNYGELIIARNGLVLSNGRVYSHCGDSYFSAFSMTLSGTEAIENRGVMDIENFTLNEGAEMKMYPGSELNVSGLFANQSSLTKAFSFVDGEVGECAMINASGTVQSHFDLTNDAELYWCGPAAGPTVKIGFATESCVCNTESIDCGIAVIADLDSSLNVNPDSVYVVCGNEPLLLSVAAESSHTYQWYKDGVAVSSGGKGPSYAVSSNGDYHVWITNTIDTTISDTVSVLTQNSPNNDLQITSEALCSGDSAQLTLVEQLGVNVIWYFKGVPIENGNSFELTAKETGQYYARLDSGDCQVQTQSKNVTVSGGDDMTLNFANDTVFCADQVTSLSLVSHSGSGVSWFYGSTLLESNVSSIELEQTGNYIAVTSGSCADSSVVVRATVNKTPGAGYAYTATDACEGEVVKMYMKSTGPRTVEWFKDGQTTGVMTDTLDVTVSGDYHVVTSKSGCSTVAESTLITIHDYNSVSLLPSGTGEICDGQSQTVTTTTDASSVLWLLDGDTVEHGPKTYLATTPGEYMAIVGTGFCADTSETLNLSVLQNPVVEIEALASTFCVGDSVMVKKVSLDGGIYEWTVNNLVVSNLTDSIYLKESSSIELKVMSGDCEGLSNEVSVSSVEYIEAKVNLEGDSVICSSDSVALIAIEAGDADLVWLKNGIIENESDTVFVKEQANYQLVTNNLGCVDMSSVFALKVDQVISPVIQTNKAELCPGAEAELTVGSSNITDFEWMYNGEFLSDVDSIVVSEEGLYQLVVLGTACADSSNKIELTEVVTEKPTFSAVGDTIICEGDLMTIKLNESLRDNWYWFLNDEFYMSNEDSLSVMLPGTYKVVSNFKGCYDTSSSVSVDVVEKVNLLLDADKSVICRGVPVNLLASDTVEVEGAYQWYKDGQLLQQATEAITVSDPGLYHVDLVLNGCLSSSNQLALSEVSSDIEVGNKDSLYCGEINDTIRAEEGLDSYTWFVNEFINTSVIGSEYPIVDSAEYRVTGVRSGCQLDTVVIKAGLEKINEPLISSSSTVICEGMEVSLTIPETSYNVRWFFDGDSVGNGNESLVVQTAGSVTVSVTGEFCMALSTPFLITDWIGDLILEQENQIICEDDSALLIVSTTYEVSWLRDGFAFDTGDSIYTSLGGDYRAVYTEGECTDTTEIIHVELKTDGCFPVQVFNVVTPNDDGIHDFLKIENIERYADNSLKVFNRWGDQVFEMSGYNNEDGVFDGNGLPAGNYYYELVVKDLNEELSGYVYLKK